MATQAATAIFEIANAPEGAEVKVLVGERTLTLKAGATKDIAHAGNWVAAFYLSVICREQHRLTKLAETPIDLLRATGAGFSQAQHQEFNDALVRALELHRGYWNTPDDGRDHKPNAAIALGPLAMACLAHDREFPIEVRSDYLPEHLLEGTWIRETAQS